MAAHWQPTAEGYFGRVTKAQILEAVREAVSDEEAARMADMTKQAMSEAAAELLSRTHWLPSLLRSSRREQVEETRSEAA